MQDLAECILGTLPPLDAAGFRLVLQRNHPFTTTIFEAKAVVHGGKVVYMARRPHGSLKPFPYRVPKDDPVPPKRDWETLVATSPVQLKFIIRQTFNDFPYANAVLLPPFVVTDDKEYGTVVPLANYSKYEVGGGDTSPHVQPSVRKSNAGKERVLDEAIAALAILKGPKSSELFSWDM